METTPYISVIIPTLQEGQLIGQTLAQFTPQIRAAYRLEIIVSDGGSTDGTLRVAEGLADVVVRNVEGRRQNISIGRNAGARAARGNVLMFINADTIIDTIEPFFSSLDGVVGDSRVAGVTCNVRVHAEEERLTDIIFHALYNGYFHFLNIVGMGMGRGECQIVSRDLFFAIGGYDERIAAGEDFDLFVRLRRRGSIAFLRAQGVRESPRRYRKYGYLAVSAMWFVNAIAVLLFRKSVTREWKPVR